MSVKAERPQNKNLKPVQKGEVRGRKAGTPNKLSRDVKEAILWAAEHSKHNKEKGELRGYMLALADKRMDTFAGMLKAMIPATAKVTIENNTSVQLTANMTLQDMVQNLDAQLKALTVPQPQPQIAAPIIEQDIVDVE